MSLLFWFSVVAACLPAAAAANLSDALNQFHVSGDSTVWVLPSLPRALLLPIRPCCCHGQMSCSRWSPLLCMQLQRRPFHNMQRAVCSRPAGAVAACWASSAAKGRQKPGRRELDSLACHRNCFKTVGMRGCLWGLVVGVPTIEDAVPLLMAFLKSCSH